jgi:predicted nuclease with TOPRIM domain
VSDLEDFGRQEDQQRAAARIAELLAENTELREAGVGYSQQTVDAITRERDEQARGNTAFQHEAMELRQRVAELEAALETAQIESETAAMDAQRWAGRAELAAAALKDNDVRGMNIIEAAVRSPSISDYMNHWEGRTLKVEAALGQGQIELAHRVCEAEAERDALRQRVTELEARDAVQYERMAHFEADNAALRERWDTLVEEARACYTTTPDSTWPSL